MPPSGMKIEVIEPHGFCSGVTAALKKAEAALAARRAGDTPLFCLHDIVHNALVTGDLASRGMRFVEKLSDVPAGATVLFSAHGVGPAVRAEAEARGLNVVDATCPFVARVHRQVCDFAARGLPVVVIGQRDHAETLGYVGEAEGVPLRVVRTADEVDFPAGTRIGVVSQTTLDAEDVARVTAELRTRYDVETSPASEVCTATRDRQNAVRAFVRSGGDGVLVLGSPASSNTRRLVEIAAAEGARAFRAGTGDDLRALDFSGVVRLGVTAGASTPENFLREALNLL